MRQIVLSKMTKTLCIILICVIWCMKGMNIKMAKPIILDVGILHRYGYGKYGEQDFSYTSKKEWDYELPFPLDKKNDGVCECAKIGLNSAILAYSSSEILKNADRMSIGVYCGTAFGGFPKSQKKQCDTLNQSGPNGILPGMSIHSGYHITADMIAIKYHIQGPNMTMVSGRLASAMAFLNAYDDIQDGTVQHAIVTGTESVDEVIIEGLRISGAGGWEGISSGACTVILSNDMAVGKTGKCVYIKSIEMQGDNFLDKNIENAIFMALKSAKLDVSDIRLVVSTQGDVFEERYVVSKVVNKIFHHSMFCPIVFSADLFGDTLGASFVMGMANVFQEHASIGNILLVTFDKNNYVLASIIGR